MILARALLAALVVAPILLLPAPARAAACCIGSTSASARLGPCEKFAVPISGSFEARFGSWDSRGDLRPLGEDRRIEEVLRVGVQLRADDRFQAGLTMPFRLQRRSVAGKSELGGGPGDLRLGFLVEPFTGLDVGPGPPTPVIGFHVQLPTGIPWSAAPGSNGAGVTGTGHVGLSPGLSLGRTFFKGGFSIDGEVTFSLPRPDDDAARVPGMAWSLSGGGSVFATPSVTVAFAGGARGVTPGLLGGSPTGWATVAPWLSFATLFRVARTDRLGLGVESSLPIPRLGRSSEATVIFTVSYTVLRRSLPAPKPRRAPPKAD